MREFSLHSARKGADANRRQWYAVFTTNKNEKAVAKHLEMRSVESFLPTYEKVSVWKNRQRIHLTLPLFPGYLFARIGSHERSTVLGTPGVIRIVGSHLHHLPIPEDEIEFLRTSLGRKKLEPCLHFVPGEKVRIKSGLMQGIEGTLVRTSSGPRLVLTIRLISQHAVCEIDAEEIEAVVA